MRDGMVVDGGWKKAAGRYRWMGWDERIECDGGNQAGVEKNAMHKNRNDGLDWMGMREKTKWCDRLTT